MQSLYELIGRHGEDIAWWQMSVRAVVVFALGLILVRVAGKRVFGKWGALDIILSVVIGSNLSRTITGGAPFLPTLAACVVLVLMHWLFAYASVLLGPVSWFMKGKPVRLVSDGVIDWRAMKRNAVGEGDLEQALRCAGMENATGVHAAYLERNGSISVVREPAGARS